MKKILQIKMNPARMSALATMLFMSVVFHTELRAETESTGLSVHSVAEQVTRKTVNLNFRNVPIRTVLASIKEQTGIGFGVNEAVEKAFPSVSIHVEGVTVEQALTEMLKESGYRYRIVNDNIVIEKIPQTNTGQSVEAIRVHGTVQAAGDKSPLVGATIRIGNSPFGTATDINGNFSLMIGKGEKLVFSFVGMVSQERVFTEATSDVVIRLVEDAIEGEEVVVTGIFTKARESYTGAVTTVTEKELKMYRGQNLVSTLRNIDPAISILADNINGSNPNSLPQINIRGNSSLPMNVKEFNEGVKQQLNAPLIIMDGFEISLEKLVDYNDEEIKSINILKDASATAIYGSRGANGVIVIVSKAPQPGKLRINAQVGVNIEIPDLSSYDLMDAAEKLALEERIGLYRNENNPAADLKLRKQYYQRYKDVQEGTDTYWLSKPLRTGVGQKYNLRLEGGSEEFRWGASFAYNTIAGVMKDSKRDNFNGAITLSYTYKNVIFKNQTNVGINKGYESNYGSFSDYANMNPYFAPRDENGSMIKNYNNIGSADLIPNPLYNASLNGKDESKYTELINNFSIEWSIREELKMRGQLGLSRRINTSDKFVPPGHTDFSSSDYEGDGFFRKGKYTYGSGEDNNYDGNLTLSYSKSFHEKHQLYAGADFSIAQRKSYDYTFVLEGFTNEDLDFPGNALQYDQADKPKGEESYTRRIGFTANVNYTYDNRYFADFSYRVDGSSQFGTDNKFAPFWSAGIGWNLHREKFLTDNKIVNNLRLKFSYGQTGSQQFSAYQALSTFKYYTDNKYLNWNGAELMGHGNKDLKWQITDQMNVGTEIGLFNNRVTASLDYYNKKTSNLLSEMDLPLATGFPSYVDNIGEVKNTGVEAALGGYIIRDTERNIMWMVNGKLTYNKNEITKLSEAVIAQSETYKSEDVDISNLFYVGRSQYSLYAVRSLGIDPSTGNEIFLDKNGNITNEWKPSDKVYMGVNEPTCRGNISTMFMYKDFTLNLSFGYHWGGKLYNQTLVDKVEVLRADISGKNLDRRVLKDRWAQPGDVVPFKKIADGTADDIQTRGTSRFIMKDNVFELQSASLQYRWAADYLKKAGIEVVNFSFNMSDVFYISSVKRERGISYPFSRKMGLTVAVMF